MKKLFLFILTIYFTTISFAQFNAFYPDGRKINHNYKTTGELFSFLGEKETSSHSLNDILVYFLKLTNKPILVMSISSTTKFISLDRIRKAITSFDYNSYINSYSYYYDLKDMMKEGSLTKEYLYKAFGNPDDKSGQIDNETWLFKNYNAKIVFNNNDVISVDVINYNAIKQNELAINTFDVTGSDYSIGFNISFSNLSSKTIKYISITVTVTNPVHDKVGTKTVKGVGPIYSNYSSTYEFPDIIYSRSAKYLRINTIKIQYMDGTIKNISEKNARNIQFQNWEEVGNRIID